MFENVDMIEPDQIRWDRIRYQRNNQSYRMLMNICYLVLGSLLLSTDKGETKLATFLDDRSMHSLYEKFILEYFRYHHPEYKANPDTIPWNIDDGMIDFLPSMVTDITLKSAGKVLIIDGGFSRAYHKETGIAGYTLIYNSYGMTLTAHEPFESAEMAIHEEKDIVSRQVAVKYTDRRQLVGDTDNGNKMKERIAELKELIRAYREGELKEKER